jgi:type VI protein secretion system component Hcp
VIVGIGRSSVSSITCKKAVDQSSMQVVQDAVTGRRLATVRLTSQNQLEVQLENAEITTIQFTTENGSQVVEISFSSQKAEISHPSSGTKISL